MTRQLLCAVSPGEVWAALREDGEVTELRIARSGRQSRVGEFHLGRIVALRPELPAALVDIGLDRPAFLSAEDAIPGIGIDRLTEGQAVLVQVKKNARADKATGVTLRPRLVGRLLELMPGRAAVTAAHSLAAGERERLVAATQAAAEPGEGFAIRANAAGADPAEIRAEVAALRARWRAVEAGSRDRHPPARLEPAATPLTGLLAEHLEPPPDEMVVDDRAAFAEARRWLQAWRPALAERLRLHLGPVPLFEQEGVAGVIEATLAPRVQLADGGALTIETTAAATFIDVDSGSRHRGSGSGAAVLETNVAAARAVARQIRLRNLAGPIVVDFVGMKRRRNRDLVSKTLGAALAEDEATAVLGWTRLGHLELVRKRRHAPLAEILFEHAPGRGLVKTAVTVALEALRAAQREADARPGGTPVLHLHPEVAGVVAGEALEARRTLEVRLGRAVEIVAEPGRARESFDIRLR